MHDLEDRLRAALTKHAADVDASEGQGQVRPQEGGPRMRWVVALLVALGFAGGVLAAGLWVAGRGDQEPAPAEKTEREVIREDPGALVCEEAPRNPQIATNEAWPRTFAGYWIDESEGILYVAFTEGAEPKVARLGECFPERTFAPVTFERSLQEMEAVLDEMLADREAIRGGTLELPGIPDHRYSFGIEVMRNVITVYMEDVTPEVSETFKSRYGSFLEVIEVEGMGPD
ncbi:MAG TPA: hypothetical protein VMP42_07740 [Actinomycetota bacterium]|nr:hypothetical protein [Actinomycetota bacterium]